MESYVEPQERGRGRGMRLDKLSKNVQGVIYQYLEGKELVRIERVCVKVRAAVTQDYLSRFLSQNSLDLASYKYYHDTWR